MLINRTDPLSPISGTARPSALQAGSAALFFYRRKAKMGRLWLLHVGCLAMLYAGVISTARAQTVTVGTTSAITAGNLTTVTVPISLALPATTTSNTTSPSAAFSAQAGLSDGSTTGQLLIPSVKAISLTTVVTDSASAWNATTNTYTVPSTGTYLIVSTVRLADGSTTGVGFGQGVSTSASDNPNYLWSTTTGLRNMLLNTRIMVLLAGQNLNLFASADAVAGLKLGSASLFIQQLQ